MKNELNQEEFNELNETLDEFQIGLAELNRKEDIPILNNFLNTTFVKIQRRIVASNKKEYIKKEISLLRMGWDSVRHEEILNSESLQNNVVKVGLSLSKLERMVD